MAHCARCGKNKGIFNNRTSEYCDDCEGIVNAELAELRRKRTENERLQREQERRRRVDEVNAR